MQRRIRLLVLLLLAVSGVSRGESLVGSYTIYFGHLHNHTSLSDGTGTPTEAYSTARSAGLDFFGLSDHGYALTTDEFTAMQTAANAANVEGVFSAFWGFEWSSSRYGHITVVNPTAFVSSSSTATDTFSEFMNWLGAQGAVAFFNHPGRNNTYGTEFEHFTGAYSGSIVGMELWNKGDDFSTYYYNDGYTTESRDRSGYYDEALFNGWSVGVGGSEDNHSATWGSSSYRLAVLSGSNTRDAIYSALGSRRFYSTLDRNLELSFQVDGSEMGSSIPGGVNQCVVKAADRDGEGFSQVEIIQNGSVVHAESVSGSLPVVACELYTQQGDYVYCKVTQSDGDEAISSPVFITSDGPDGPPRADLVAPLDNGSDDLDPTEDCVTVNTTEPSFQIQLTDFDGIDPLTVTPDTVSITGLMLNEHYAFAYDSGTDVITLTPLTAGAFGDGTYAITLSGISDLAIPPSTMAATTLTTVIDTSIVLPETLSFTGAVDTMIKGAAPATSYSASSTLTVDTDDNSTGLPSQALIRFDNIVGTAGDQIPAYSTIKSATLRLWSLDSGNGGSLHAMLQAWSDTATWDSLLGEDGIQADGIEASSSADDSISVNSSGYVDLDVTYTVQNWADGALANDGWVILPNGADGWDFASAEYSMAGYRPALTVTFTPSATGGNRAPVADAGADQTVNDDDGDGSETVTLSASARDLDGYICSYAWTEGTALLGETSTLTYPFSVGVHTVSLTVWDDDGASGTGTVLITVTEEMIVVDRALGETLAEGTITAGDYQGTWSSADGVVEVIREAISGNNKNIMRSSLEHIWQFDVTGGDAVVMHLAATAQLEAGSPDQFVFAYSTDGVSYIDIASCDEEIAGAYALPGTLRGTLYVRVLDTNSDKLEPTADSILVDCISIRSTTTGVPDTDPPSSPTGLTATSSGSDVQLSWNANGESDLAGYHVYRSTFTTGYSEVSNGLVAGTSFSDTGLAAGSYSYVVRAEDLFGNLSGNSNEATVTVTEAPPEQYISVSSIAVVVNKSKKYTAEATVTVLPGLSGAEATGEWYFKGLKQGTASGTTTNGVAVISTPFETPAKSGDVFTFVVTNVAFDGYTYNPNGVTEGSAVVP